MVMSHQNQYFIRNPLREGLQQNNNLYTFCYQISLKETFLVPAMGRNLKFVFSFPRPLRCNPNFSKIISSLEGM